MPIPNPWPIAVKIPVNLFLKIALLITTIILGPGDIAPNKHTNVICINNKKSLFILSLLLFHIYLNLKSS